MKKACEEDDESVALAHDGTHTLLDSYWYKFDFVFFFKKNPPSDTKLFVRFDPQEEATMKDVEQRALSTVRDWQFDVVDWPDDRDWALFDVDDDSMFDGDTLLSSVVNEKSELIVFLLFV